MKKRTLYSLYISAALILGACGTTTEKGGDHVPTDKTYNVIDLPKQKVLAQMVNTTRETVSRTLNLLIDQGLIQKINGSWVIQDANGFGGINASLTWSYV